MVAERCGVHSLAACLVGERWECRLLEVFHKARHAQCLAVSNSNPWPKPHAGLRLCRATSQTVGLVALQSIAYCKSIAYLWT